MSSKSYFSFVSEPYADFDVESHSEQSSSSSSSDGRNDEEDGKAVIVPTIPTNANHLLLVSLLEHVCSLYIKNPKKKDMLFKLLCKQLAKMNIMSPLSGLDELGAIKTQYKQSFAKLLHTCVTHLKLKSHLALPSTSQDPRKMLLDESLSSWQQPKLELSNYMSFHTSRYRDEYEEVSSLGKGAYGSVYKTRHKLDGRYYAVKKVAFQDNTPDLWNKTLREVKHLADLNHPSVIRYYTAWLEYDLPNVSGLPQKSCDDFDLPALTYTETTKDSYLNSASNNSQSSSIVFEDSKPCTSKKYSRMRSWDVSGPDKTRTDWFDLKQTSLPVHPSRSEGFLLEHCHVVLHIQMELCAETLQDWLLSRNNLFSSHEVYNAVNEEMNLFILSEILLGVDYLQKNNLMHRDLKPSNIFLNGAKSSEKLTVKIGDFGLVRRNCGSCSTSDTSVPSETPLTPAPGLLEEHVLDWNGLFLTSGVGTTIYASPEQLAGVEYGPKSDMYSIGLILFELYQPFCTGMERSKTLMDIRKGIISPMFTERWSMLSQTIEKLTSVDPEQRPSAHCLLNGTLFNTETKTVEALHEELQKKDVELSHCQSHILELEELLKAKDLEIHRLNEMMKPRLDGQGDVDR